MKYNIIQKIKNHTGPVCTGRYRETAFAVTRNLLRRNIEECESKEITDQSQIPYKVIYIMHLQENFALFSTFRRKINRQFHPWNPTHPGDSEKPGCCLAKAKFPVRSCTT